MALDLARGPPERELKMLLIYRFPPQPPSTCCARTPSPGWTQKSAPLPLPPPCCRPTQQSSATWSRGDSLRSACSVTQDTLESTPIFAVALQARERRRKWPGSQPHREAALFPQGVEPVQALPLLHWSGHTCHFSSLPTIRHQGARLLGTTWPEEVLEPGSWPGRLSPAPRCPSRGALACS